LPHAIEPPVEIVDVHSVPGGQSVIGCVPPFDVFGGLLRKQRKTGNCLLGA
jgi:hypothetical protein